MDITTQHSPFYGIFLRELGEILECETGMPGIMTLVQGSSYSVDLRSVANSSRAQSQRHLEALSGLMHWAPAEKIHCSALATLSSDVHEAIENFELGMVRDMSLILAVEKMLMHKIACYENLATLAEILGFPQAVQPLETAIVNENCTALLLRELAERYIYRETLREDKYRTSTQFA